MEDAMSGREADGGGRGRLGRDEVLAAAEELVDLAGWDGLTMSALAMSLGVRAPSLYHHVDGLEALRGELQVRSMAALSDALMRASVGQSGTNGVRVQAQAQRDFARTWPHRYDGMTRAAIDPAGVGGAGALATEVSVKMLLTSGVPDEVAQDLVRALFAAHHGAIQLELSGFFSIGVDHDALFELVLDNTVRAIEHSAGEPA
jgi:AcrR family transcriptional regulator